MYKGEESKMASEVVGRMVERVLSRAGSGGEPVEEIINETLYHENLRLSRAGDSDEAKADRAFYGKIRHELPRASINRQHRLLHDVVARYAREIQGHFDPKAYAVATKLAPPVMNALLNGLSPTRLVTRLRDVPTIDEHLIIQGEVDRLLKLHERGTIVLTPTHSSNLDSIMLGFALQRLGLPPFTYGAGLNLFSNPIVGYFMHNLGAYTVDRLKTDPLYRETLKEYATVTLEFDADNLFFPGGTRSRSGALERHLKKGLLGTSVAAYRGNLQRAKSNPGIYIVPCTISYPLVLEAATLIDDYLREAGKQRYIIVDDEFSKARRWLDFLRGLFALDLRIYLTIGKPLDPFGNDVDEQGNSLDPRGRAIDSAEYLKVDGEIAEDSARDAVYTGNVARRIGEAFHRENVALPTNVVAFVFFELLRRKSNEDDLYRFLRGLGPEISLPMPEVEQALAVLLEELHALASSGGIRLSRSVGSGDVAEIMRRALKSFGTYHTEPVIQRKGVRLHVGDGNLIFYYRNRLDGYGLMGTDRLVQARRPG